MPLITWGYLAYLSGLLTGYVVPPVLATCLVIAAGTTTVVAVRRCVVVGCVLIFVTGVLVAATSPPRARGMFAVPAAQGRGFLTTQRLRATAAIDTVFRGDAPLARALLVADQGQMPREVKDRYADAGIIHMLSISGLHVAIIAATIELLFHIVRLPARVASAAAVAAIMGYVAILGWPPPAVRSGVMLAVVAASRAFQRPTSRWASLASGGLVPLLLDPHTALDLGYQLSIGGIAGLVASGALARRVIPDTLTGWRGSLARGLLASSVATFVSVPLVAPAFGRLSLAAPVTNLFADPVLGLAQPILFLALLAAPIAPIAHFLADAAHPLLALFDRIAVVGAALPFAAVAVAPSPAASVLAGLASVAFVIACVSRFPGRPLVIAAGAVCAIVWMT